MAQLWFKFWAKEYLSDAKVRALTYEQRGILQTLWSFSWEEGSIPANPETLATMLGVPAKAMRSHMPWVMHFFQPSISDPSMLISPRLEIERSEAESKGMKARESALRKWEKVRANADANAEQTDKPTLCDPPCVSHASQSQSKEKELPPTPKGARRQRSRVEILEPFGPEVCRVVNTLLDEWRLEDPKDGRKITASPEDTGKAVDSILKAQPNVTGEILIQAARNYLASKRERYKAPQYFFGPEGPWDGFVKGILTVLSVELPHAI